MKTLEKFKTLDLPVNQKRFLGIFDGSVESLLKVPYLGSILNPVFTGHWFYVSGDSPETTITTRDTDGSYANYGDQSKEAENNAYDMAVVVKQIIKNLDFKFGRDIFTIDQQREMGKPSAIKRRAYVMIEGNWINLSGITERSF